jgi:hypothetical protein
MEQQLMIGGWELGFGLGALALLLTLAYGVIQARRASPAADRAGEAGARRLYDNPGESEASPDTARQKKAPPLVWIMAGLLAVWLVAIFTLGDRIQDHGDEATTAALAGEPRV